MLKSLPHEPVNGRCLEFEAEQQCAIWALVLPTRARVKLRNGQRWIKVDPGHEMMQDQTTRDRNANDKQNKKDTSENDKGGVLLRETLDTHICN